MKILLSILLYLLSIGLAVSQEYNRKNRYGQKIGEWVEYFPEGYKKSIRYYKPMEFRLDTFLLPRASSALFDTIISPHTDYVKMSNGYVPNGTPRDQLSEADWMIGFEYDANWQLKRATKRNSDGTYVYLYGIQHQIDMANHSFQLKGIVENSYQIGFPLSNLSDSIVPLRFENLPKNFSANDAYFIPPNSEYQVVINIVLEQYHRLYKIDLVGNNMRIELLVSTEGYHYRTSDFQGSKAIILRRRIFVMKRANSEGLLTILDNKKMKPIRQIPLSYMHTQIDLTDLSRGQIHF